MGGACTLGEVALGADRVWRDTSAQYVLCACLLFLPLRTALTPSELVDAEHGMGACSYRGPWKAVHLNPSWTGTTRWQWHTTSISKKTN
jgi:hypothetical protein